MALRVIEGRGTLFVDGEERGWAAYRLECVWTEGLWHAEGLLAADRGLFEAFNSEEPAIVRLEDGSETHLIVTRLELGDGKAEVRATGRIAGL